MAHAPPVVAAASFRDGSPAVGVFFTPELVGLFELSTTAAPHAVLYLRISLLGVPASILGNELAVFIKILDTPDSNMPVGTVCMPSFGSCKQAPYRCRHGNAFISAIRIPACLRVKSHTRIGPKQSV